MNYRFDPIGLSYGTIYKMTTAGAITTLHTFTGTGTDGANPIAGLVRAADGDLYGTTQLGGTYNKGTVFKITTSGTHTTLYSFGATATDAVNPAADLIQGASPDTNLYGTTQYGGASNNGTVFKITTSGTLTVLYSFSGSDGMNPVAGLVQGASPDTNLYGTTQNGGTNGLGTIFKISTAGSLITLRHFAGGSEGSNPAAALIRAADGNYYGTVLRGETNADGTAFKTTSTGTFTLLHTFIGSDGTEPKAGLVQGANPDTNFYGTTPGDNSLTALKQQQFRDGVAEWAAFANVHFVEFISGAVPTNFITVQESPPGNEGGFSSSVGKAGGEQFVQFGLHSWNRGTVCHEVGHALGLWHEQQRTDRDTYVTINFSNIPTGLQPNFAIITGSDTQITAYDFYSIMHYTRNTFAINPNIDTIIMNAGYTQYADVIGKVYDRVLSKIERAGMATVYGNPSPLPSAVVTSTKDSGPGSLRTAIYYAFDKSTDPSPIATPVTFNIPINDPNFSGGVFSIKPTAGLPALGNGTTVDGTSQTAFTGDTNTSGPEIAVDGSNFASNALGGEPFNFFTPGLILRAANCTIKGLTIQNFNERNIDIFQGTDPNGSAATGNVIGGTTAAERNVISGSGTYGIGIHDSTTTGNFIRGNYIGTNQGGTAAQANAIAGVVIYSGAHGNTVGGTAAGAGNVISGNTNHGVFIGDAGSNNNLVQGNKIGLNAAGDAAIPNNVAIEITAGAQSNTIGGTTSGAGNTISGNTFDGISINDFNDVSAVGTRNNVVQGNLIGVNNAAMHVGDAAIPNHGGGGVDIFAGAQSNTIGGTASGAGNLISGNQSPGIAIGGTGTNNNLVQGNVVGLNAAGTGKIHNGDGIALCCGAQLNTIGGTTTAARNIISGNQYSGISIGSNETNNNLVQGNYIGLDATGSTVQGNTFDGIAIYGDGPAPSPTPGPAPNTGAQSNTIGGLTSGARNIISGNGGNGVSIGNPGSNGTNNNLVQGNYIGTDPAGTTAKPNAGAGVVIYGGTQSNTIGGTTPSGRNVISGNTGQGVAIGGLGGSLGATIGPTQNVVAGNYIGLDATGVAKIANNSTGVDIYGTAQSNTIGGTWAGARNFICGSTYYGVALSGIGTNSNLVQGNTIGLNVGGTIIANGLQGVALFQSQQADPSGPQSNLIGGSALGASNIIAGNTSEGVAVFDAGTLKNTIRQNSIFSNSAKGIALSNGGNNSQPAPTSLSPAVSTAANPNGTDVGGTYSGSAATIEFFASPTGDPSGFGEGQYFIGSISTGSGSFTAHLAAAVPVGYVISATSTDANGSTSEFSQDATVPAFADNGNDSIPDQWMQSHFGHIDPRMSDRSRASDGADGDGLTNLQEYRAAPIRLIRTARFALNQSQRMPAPIK